MAWPVRAAPSGSKMSWLTCVDVAAGALQNIGVAVDHRVEQFHQHHLAGDAGRAGARQLVLHQRERLRLVVAHRHQAMAGEDEGHRRGPRIVGVGCAHQRRRHVARAVLDIEPAGDLDLLHVLPGRHRDPGQPLHRLVLRRGRLDQVDPDRTLRQRGEIDGATFFSEESEGTKTENMENSGTGTATITQQDLARFWQALHDRRINRRSTFVAARWQPRHGRFGSRAHLPKNQPEAQHLRQK